MKISRREKYLSRSLLGKKKGQQKLEKCRDRIRRSYKKISNRRGEISAIVIQIIGE
jgi:hypothetical protein